MQRVDSHAAAGVMLAFVLAACAGPPDHGLEDPITIQAADATTHAPLLGVTANAVSGYWRDDRAYTASRSYPRSGSDGSITLDRLPKGWEHWVNFSRPGFRTTLLYMTSPDEPPTVDPPAVVCAEEASRFEFEPRAGLPWSERGISYKLPNARGIVVIPMYPSTRPATCPAQ